MTDRIQFKYHTADINKTENVGHHTLIGETVVMASCPFCGAWSSFYQASEGRRSYVQGQMVALFCANCESVVSCDLDNYSFFPAPTPEGIQGLPDEIQDYYDEGLRCLGANAPNGAATVFRKVIHSVCVYYDIADVDSNDSFYQMIQALADNDHITETLRQSLLGIKDAGNDGAHVNDNDPSLEQAKNMKEILDAVLNATVVADEKIEYLREEHPNPHQE